MSVRVIKMVEEPHIIGEFTETEDTFTVENGIQMFLSPQGLNMLPMCPFGKEKSVTIPKRFLVYTVTPEDEVLNIYNEKFGSGIVIGSAAQSNLLKLHK